MEKIKESLDSIFSEHIKKVVFSNQKDKGYSYRKITVEEKKEGYQAEKLTEKPVSYTHLDVYKRQI